MLVSPKNSFQGQGLRSPEDFYWVIQDPVPLAGMCLQETNWPWQSICDCGFTNLISLHPMDYDPTPLTSIHDQPLEDLISGDSPKDTVLEIRRIRSTTSSSSHWVTVKELLTIAGGDEVELEQFPAVIYVSWVMRDNPLWSIWMRFNV